LNIVNLIKKLIEIILIMEGGERIGRPPVIRPTLSSPSEQVDLYISARNLKDLDYFSRDDPYCVVF
jgi:hypothetical protein